MREVLSAFLADWKRQWRQRSNPSSPGLRAGRRSMAAAALLTITWTTMMVLNANPAATLLPCLLSGAAFITMMITYGNAREHDPQMFDDLALTMPNLLLVLATGGIFIWAGFALLEWLWLIPGAVLAYVSLRIIIKWYHASHARVRHGFENLLEAQPTADQRD